MEPTGEKLRALEKRMNDFAEKVTYSEFVARSMPEIKAESNDVYLAS